MSYEKDVFKQEATGHICYSNFQDKMNLYFSKSLFIESLDDEDSSSVSSTQKIGDKKVDVKKVDSTNSTSLTSSFKGSGRNYFYVSRSLNLVTLVTVKSNF